MSMNKHKKKNKRFSRAVILTTVLAILVFGSVSTTIAFLITGTESIKNVFFPAEVKTKVHWTYNDDSKTSMNVKVKNESDIDVYIRAVVTVNWVKIDQNGIRHIYSEAPVGSRINNGVLDNGTSVENNTDYDYTMNLQSGQGTWLLKDYGGGEIIFYYTEPVWFYNNGGNENYTSNLFSQFQRLYRDGQPEGYDVEVEVVASGIQTVPANVVQDEWGVELDDSGNIIAVK